MTLLMERHMGAGQVDRGNFVIHNVKIVGTTSKNGYDYSPAALKRAAHLYEGKTVNISHPKPMDAAKDRGILESPGWLENIVFRPDGLYGDLHLFESHPATSLILEKAEKTPQNFGMSHNADGRREKIDGRMTITEISEVRSVDLVGIPATTAGLFESVQDERNYYERELSRLQAERARLEEDWTPDTEPEEKGYYEVRQEVRRFGKVLDHESEFDQILLESRKEKPAHLGEYERARSELRR